MSWFSFRKKDKPESSPEQNTFFSQDDEAVPVRARGRSKSKDDQIDPALPEKKRARRRLVGAVAITLALVIALPMVLDSEPKPVSGDVVINIPSKNKQSPLNASAPAAAVEAPAPETPKPAASTVAPAAEKTPAAAQAAPETKKPAKEHEKDKAKAKESDANPVAASEKVMIQVAALASADKVKELRNKLSKAGFKSQTQKVATNEGERIRVKVGPYASKKEAEKYCPKLQKMKLKCAVQAS